MSNKNGSSTDNKTILNEDIATSIYRNIVDSVFAPPTFLADPGNGYQLLYANQACLNFGIDLAVKPLTTLTEIIPTITQEKLNTLWREVLECGNATMLTEYHKPQGQLVSIELSVQGVQAGQNLMLGHIRDATEQVKTLEVLTAKEQEFRSLTENSPFSIIRYDRDGYIRYVNAKLGRDLGVSAAEVIGKLPNEVWPDKRFDAIQQAAAQVVASEIEVTIEILGPEAEGEGEPTFHKINIIPERNVAGHVIGTIAYGTDITAQKRYTQSLFERAQLEKKLSGLAASVPGFIFTLRLAPDRHISFPFASVGIEELVGLRPEDIRDDVAVLHERYHPDDLPRVYAHMEESEQALSAFRIEIRVYHPEHGMRWVEIRSMPLRLDDGTTEWHGFMFDITERIQAKQAILHTQNALEEAQRIAHIGSWDVDRVNDVLTWSDETYRIWEVDKIKFLATFAAFLETVHPDDRKKVTDAYNQAIINKSLYEVEHRLLFPDGRVKYIQERGEPYFDEDGHSIRFIGTALDITERKQFEELVSLQNYALDHIGEAVYLVDEHARILHVNNAACKMLGYTQDELLAMRIFDLNPNVDPAYWQEHWNDLLHHQTITLETVHRSKEGTFVPIEVNANAIEHEGKRFNFALVRDITERKRIEAKMQHQASYDMLTGLPNRRLLVDRLREEISRAKRSGSNVSILFIDLDRFKEVNDTLGHHQGDQLLIQAAQRIQQCVRESDTLARMGGDEFVVILSGATEMAHLERVAQGIIEVMTTPFVLDNQISYVTASIGIANYPSDVDSLEGLISAADQAMYVAKERGRNGFSFFTPAMQKQVQQRLSLANDLREAMLKEQLQIYLQPIVDISTGHVVKAEALLRWKHPQHGMVPPDKFIPIAEEVGLIHEIGDWVFRQAAQAMSRWLAICTLENGCCQISVNMSARQFIPSQFGTAWIKHLATISVPANHMVIEITESLLLGDEVDIMGKLHRFREAGITVALDDFGTGYSAMSYLKKFNIDYLKIDRSFVRDLETDQNDRAIAEAIVVMAHKLGLKTIAEGVETEQQKAILAEVGCDYVQGYFYAQPMPVDEFLSFVQIKVQKFVCASNENTDT